MAARQGLSSLYRRGAMKRALAIVLAVARCQDLMDSGYLAAPP